jgi:hypothetical protein
LKFPPNVETLHVASTNICDIQPFVNLNKLKILKANITNIDNIDALPDSVTDLSVSRVMLFRTGGVINRLPSKIEKFTCHSSGIRHFSFSYFPQTLDYLDLYDNELESLPVLPNKMSYLDIAKNRLKTISNIPKEITSCDCSKNPGLTFSAEQNELIKSHKSKIGITFSSDNSEQDDLCDDYISQYIGQSQSSSGSSTQQQHTTNTITRLNPSQSIIINTIKSQHPVNDAFTELMMNEGIVMTGSTHDNNVNNNGKNDEVVTMNTNQNNYYNNNDTDNSNTHRVRNLFASHDNRNSNRQNGNVSMNISTNTNANSGYTPSFNRGPFSMGSNSNNLGMFSGMRNSGGIIQQQPSHMMRLMSDNFHPNKRETHRIKHQHVYTV